MAEPRRVPLWLQVALPLVVVCIALLIGGNAFKGSNPTVAQRAAALESLVRCPSCIDVSVADSNESTAIAVRHEIERQVRQGRSTSQIEQTLVSQYGPTILLEPPDSAGFALIWMIPIVLGAGALAGVGVLFWRRTRQFLSVASGLGPGIGPMSETTNAPSKSEQRWFLTDQREFLQRSLRDADAELAAGDLSPEDHAVLTTRDRTRLEEVTVELSEMGVETDDLIEEQSDETDEGPTRADWRRIGIIACCFLIVAGVVILVDHALSPRLPGQATSGSITLPKAQLIEQQLAQAASLSNAGRVVSARLYDKVLSEDPNDPNALAGSGWLEWNYGTAAREPTLESAGYKAEKKATEVAPTLFAGHFFLGLILFEQYDNYRGAVVQFNDFLAEHPPASEVTSVASLIRGAYMQAGVPVPAALAG